MAAFNISTVPGASVATRGQRNGRGHRSKALPVEWIFYRTVGRRLADETTRRGRGILTFGQTVDAVVQQNHVQVDITAYGVDEVVTADGQTVTVAGDLPYRQVGIGNLAPVEMAAARPWMVCIAYVFM